MKLGKDCEPYGTILYCVLAIGSGLFNFFDSFLFTFYVLYLTKIIGVTPLLVGIIIAISSVGGLLGAIFVGRITRLLGLGRALLAGVLLASLGEFTIALAQGPMQLAILLVILGEGSVQVGAVLYGVNGLSLRQATVPNRLQGRVNATLRIIAVGVVPLGALLGGFIGDTYGLRTTVLVAGGGTLLAFLWVLFSPVRKLRERPNEA